MSLDFQQMLAEAETEQQARDRVRMNRLTEVHHPLVDLVEAARFLTLLDESADTFTFQTFDDSPAKRPALARIFHGTLAEHGAALVVRALAALNARGAGVFVTINETDLHGRKTANVMRVRAVFCDTDGAPLEPIMTCGLEPTFVVESSPGKYHVYWSVDNLPLDEFAGLQRAIAAKFGTDPSVCDLPRVMRVPGFPHNKGEPFQTRIIHESGALPFTPERVRMAFVAPAAPMAPPQVPEGSTAPLVKPDSDGDRVEVNRHQYLLKRSLLMAAAVKGGSITRTDALAALIAERDGGKYTREIPDKEITDALDGALMKSITDTPIEVKSDGPKVRTATDLLAQTFAPTQWGVRGILPEGISILSGDPKIGKSWFMYQACVAVATGSPLWAGRDPEEPGDVLMLALEDNDKRLQKRLHVLLPHFQVASKVAIGKGAKFTTPDVTRLHYATEWPRAEAGVAHLAEWMRSHPGVRLVVIDTVSAFRNPDPGRKSAYAHDYAVGEMLRPLAQEFSAAIVLVMHNRKQAAADALQLVSGTQGMTGGVDNVLVLRRERGQLDAGLYVDGRDIDEPQELAMRFHAGLWSSDGTSVEEAQQSKERRRVLAVVEELGCKAVARAIADAMPEKKYGTVRWLLTVLVKSGALKNVDGLYVPTHTH